MRSRINIENLIKSLKALMNFFLFLFLIAVIGYVEIIILEKHFVTIQPYKL